MLNTFTYFYTLHSFIWLFLEEWISKAYTWLLSFFSLQAPESYKNVTDVVNTCHEAGISKKAIKLRPIAVIKG